jgi:hypothetical protein
MVKIGDTSYDASQSINLLSGVAMTGQAIQMVAAPANYQVRCLVVNAGFLESASVAGTMGLPCASSNRICGQSLARKVCAV